MENYNRIEKTEWGIHYYLNDKLHRIDGPAVEYYDRTKIWYKNGLLHRLDGPAFEWSNEYKSWHYEGKRIDCNSQEEFERLIKLKLFW
jgi:hypothetical protein